MSALLTEIWRVNAEAARVLQEAGCHADPEIQSLTREDLHELFPGVQMFRLRRKIFEIIQGQKAAGVLNKLKRFNPSGFLRSEAQTVPLPPAEVLVECLHMMKDMKTQLTHMQNVLEVHIDQLEKITTNQANPQLQRGSLSGTANSAGPVQPHTNQAGIQPQGPQATVKYHMAVSGKTFGAHQQLMDQVKGHSSDGVQFIESREDCQIIVLFCPISSRVASDVDAAMTSVRGDRPVILVLMHHAREAKYPTYMRTWDYGTNVVLQVSIFYHETANGLLKCQQNNLAVSDIRQELLRHCDHRGKDISTGCSSRADSVGESDGNCSASTGHAYATAHDLFSIIWPSQRSNHSS